MTDQIPAEAVRVQRLDDGGLALTSDDGSCGYVDAIAVDALREFLRPEPSEDEREALELLLYDTYQDAAGMATVGTSWLHEFAQHYAGIILAAGFTRRPTPSREEIGKALDSSAPLSRESAIDAVLALFKGGDRG
jgi:hypothetical protein